MAGYERWAPERQPSTRACDACKANPERQVLPGHDACLPPITGRYTADNVPVAVGLRVWDYDLRSGTVIEVDHSFQGTPDGPLGIVAWHMVERDDGQGRNMFDGSRMCTTHPSDGRRPKNCCPDYAVHLYTDCPELREGSHGFLPSGEQF